MARKLELFNDHEIGASPEEPFIRQVIPVSPEGGYRGNGEYKNPKGKVFKITGFDKTRGRHVWVGQAFTKEGK